ncbi:MAG TPA: hypothetical protein VGN51_20760 [Acidimicrobiia bacterium]|jgi:hypothetical protein
MRGRQVALLAAGCVVFVIVVTTAANRAHIYRSDGFEIQWMIHYIQKGEIDKVYRPGAWRFSPPGMPLLLALPVTIFGNLRQWFAVVGAASALVVAFSAWSMGLRSIVRCAALAVLFVLMPPIIDGTIEWGHPTDVLAAALLVAAIAFGMNERWLWFGATIAVAILCRQIVVIGALPLIALVPAGRRLRTAALLVGIVVVISAPFALSQKRWFYKALTQNLFRVEKFQPVPNVFSGHDALAFIGREVPIIVAVIVAVWVLRTRPGPYAWTLAAALPFVVRDVLDPAGFLYYAVPSVTLLLVADVVFNRRWWLVPAWAYLRCWIHWGASTGGGPSGIWAMTLALFEGLTIAYVAREMLRGRARKARIRSVSQP